MPINVIITRNSFSFIFSSEVSLIINETISYFPLRYVKSLIN